MNMIRLEKLTKLYRDFRAVDSLDLAIEPGRIFGFLGPNGAGKTTTIKMMAGVLKPTSGNVIINNIDLLENPLEVKRCVGFIPDRPFLYDKLSGLEFLNFVAGIYQLDYNHSLKNRVIELLDIFELKPWSDELIESYSHGMKQRLVMCSALLHQPKVIIVDEPMVGLDPKAARLVKSIFKDQAYQGVTIFMSTHSLEVAQEVCQEIAIIQSGKIIARGSTEELKKQSGLDGDLESIFLKLTDGKPISDGKSLSSS
jgi:ABC-2 type transport system ATP-binding protein